MRARPTAVRAHGLPASFRHRIQSQTAVRSPGCRPSSTSRCIPMLAPLRTACDACHTFRYLTIMEQSSMSAPPTHTTATLRRLIFAYWRSNERATASALLLGVLALTLGMVFMNVQINRWQNVFFNALGDKNEHALYAQLGRFIVLAGIWVALYVYSQYLTQMLQMRWRRWLTEDFLASWLSERTYYRMQFAGERTDNPDQRIAEDLRIFVEQGAALFLGLLNASVTLLSFVGILWALSGTFVLHWGNTVLSIPGYVVWVAVLYALIGNGVAHLIGRPLVQLNFDR